MESPGSGTIGATYAFAYPAHCGSFFAITDVINLVWFGRLIPYFYRRVTVAFAYHDISREGGLSPETTLMANSKRVSLVSYGHSLPLTRSSDASSRYTLQRVRPLIQDINTNSEAPWGIHKHNCNSSRTVWENAEKTNETLVEISVPGEFR